MKRLLLTGCMGLAACVYGQTNRNCSGATQVCNDVSFSGNSTGYGTQDLNTSNHGCLSVEHQSSWYFFVPVTSGTVALSIQTSVDYDFAIWATNNCSNLGTPVRCSYSAQAGNTGLAASYQTQTSATGCGPGGTSPCYSTTTVTDVSEGTGGDRWVMPLNVSVGQTYIMLIDNYTANSTPFTLSWTFTNGASLNCAPSNLPVELVEFMATYDEQRRSNTIYWETLSERLNDYFTLERSSDMSNWTIIDQQPGQELSTERMTYFYEDHSFEAGTINYYRLSQTDYDGTKEVFEIVAVKNDQVGKKIVKVLNPMGQEVPPDTPGLVILVYEDGTTQRVFR